MIVGTELIAGRDTDPAVVDFVEAFARAQLGREIVRTHDTPAFAGNRVGFKVLNEAAQLAEQIGPLLVDRLVGPYTGRAMTPLATIDLVGWDIHRAIVDNVYANTRRRGARHAAAARPTWTSSWRRACSATRPARGFFKKEGKVRHVLDAVSGDYRPESEMQAARPRRTSTRSPRSTAQARYAEGIQVFLAARRATRPRSRAR